MSWKVRHQGSPQSVEAPSLAAVVEGLQDGQWDTTDEVMGPGETTWTPIEGHPQLEEIAAEIEPPPPRLHEDEARLDMNAMIDVTLVLLIFFILTASYVALQAKLDTPQLNQGDPGRAVSVKQADETMIKVSVKLENGKPTTRIEDREIDPKNLEAELSKVMRNSRKTIVLLDTDREVPTGAVVAVQDAAAGAGVQKICRLMPPKKP
jgi:biopolymer transport protein ExbD